MLQATQDKLLHSKGNHKKKKNEKTTQRRGENLCKGNRQGIHLQNIQISHTALYRKNKPPNQKWSEDLNRH